MKTRMLFLALLMLSACGKQSSAPSGPEPVSTMNCTYTNTFSLTIPKAAPNPDNEVETDVGTYQLQIFADGSAQATCSDAQSFTCTTSPCPDSNTTGTYTWTYQGSQKNDWNYGLCNNYNPPAAGTTTITPTQKYLVVFSYTGSGATQTPGEHNMNCTTN